MTWMMDLEILEHVENISYIKVINIAPRKDGFEEIRTLAQYWKSRSRIISFNMELKSVFE